MNFLQSVIQTFLLSYYVQDEIWHDGYLLVNMKCCRSRINYINANPKLENKSKIHLYKGTKYLNNYQLVSRIVLYNKHKKVPHSIIRSWDVTNSLKKIDISNVHI